MNLEFTFFQMAYIELIVLALARKLKAPLLIMSRNLPLASLIPLEWSANSTGAHT